MLQGGRRGKIQVFILRFRQNRMRLKASRPCSQSKLEAVRAKAFAHLVADHVANSDATDSPEQSASWFCSLSIPREQSISTTNDGRAPNSAAPCTIETEQNNSQRSHRSSHQ